MNKLIRLSATSLSMDSFATKAWLRALTKSQVTGSLLTNMNKFITQLNM